MLSAPTPDTVAAVDLGSNSFHLIVARLVEGRIHVLDRLRERVALAEGLGPDKRLHRDARERAYSALELFGQRLRHMPAGTVRAVGTNTLRQAKDGRSFQARAEELLGHPVEVISGYEEARLIYLGVAHDIEEDRGKRLVVDIGGGSTECIIGEGFEPVEADSLYMGCVTFSLRYFPGGEIRPEYMEAAEVAASLEVQTIARRYRQLGWNRAYGASGTVRAVESILAASGFSDEGITEKGIRKLRKALIAAGHASRLALPGMPADRAAVLPGGVAILGALFHLLGIEKMTAANGALREGLVYDLVGRIQHRDVREGTIRSMSERYHVEVDQADRVERTSLALLDQVATSWELADDSLRQALRWAARLHEIGLAISHSGFHQHGAYLVEHSDMPGFSKEDQALLAMLVLSHRRKLRRGRFDELPAGVAPYAFRLCILLRLAVRLNRSRSPDAVPNVRLSARKKTLELAFPAGYLDAHPLTRADFAEEAEVLAGAGYSLKVS